MTRKNGLPPIVISDVDYERLERLVSSGIRLPLRAYPPTARLLARELERAIVMPAGGMKDDVVAMHSELTYRDDLTGIIRRVTLVFPGEEDRDHGRVSIFTPLGAALIGLSEGQSIDWRTVSHGSSRLSVLRVHPRRSRRAPQAGAPAH